MGEYPRRVARTMGFLHRLRWNPALELWLDGELDSARIDAVLLHLEDCPDCGEVVEALARLKASLARIEVG